MPAIQIKLNNLPVCLDVAESWGDEFWEGNSIVWSVAMSLSFLASPSISGWQTDLLF